MKSQGDPVEDDEMEELSLSPIDVESLAAETAIVGGGGMLCFVSSASFSSILTNTGFVSLLATLSSLPSSSDTTDEVALAVFLLLPFGAGSRFGVVRLYVTVLVTTLRTLTGLLTALRGVEM